MSAMGQLNTTPAFTVDLVTMQRRMRFNPLRMATPERLSMAHDQFDMGILNQAALLWDAIARRDDTLSFVVPQLENSIAGKPWGVFKRKGADPAEAARHAAALEYFYDNVVATDAFDRNERGDRHLLLKQMSRAYAYRYAVHHFVWRPEPGRTIEVEGAAPAPALSAEMEFVPLWYFENTTGTLRFLPEGGYGTTGEEMNFEGEWMCTTGAGAMFAASACYIFKRLTFQDWTIFNERYAQQKVFAMTPEGPESPQSASLRHIVNDFNGDMGAVLHGVEPGGDLPIKLLGPSGTVSVDLFERFLDRQDRKMTVLFRGSDLRNMSREKDTTGVSAQIQETEALERAHCASIASACRAFIDRAVIRYCFGEGVEPLAYFGLPDMDDDDAGQLRENAGFLADRGVLVDAATIADRLGVTTTEEEEAALGGSKKLEVRSEKSEGRREDGEDLRTGNAAARLDRLIRRALISQNAGYHPGQLRDGLGQWTEFRAADKGGESGAAERKADGTVTLSGEEFGKNIGINELRKAARSHMESLRGKFITNTSTNVPILIDRKGAREVVSNFRKVEELQAVAGIENMIERATYVKPLSDEKRRPDIKAWHEYEVPVRIGTEKHQFTIKVRELRDGHRFYDSYRKKEEPAAKSGTASKTLGGPKANTGSERKVSPMQKEVK